MTENKASHDTGPEPETSGSELSNASAEDLVLELAATKDRLVEVLADQKHAHVQARRDRDEAVRHAAAIFARDLLSSIDNLERTIRSVPEDKLYDPIVANLMAGVDATRRALLDTFCRHGIKRIEPLGERFNPHLHKARFETADSRHPQGTVTMVFQPGYLHQGRLLRPAVVAVNRLRDSPPDYLATETTEIAASVTTTF